MPDIISIKDLHFFTGHPGQFWPAFLAFACRQIQADSCILLTKKSAGWQHYYQWPEQQPQRTSKAVLSPQLLHLVEESLKKGQVVVPGQQDNTPLLIGLRLDGQQMEAPKVGIFRLPAQRASETESISQILQLLADTPKIYQRERANQQAQQNQVCFAETLDLLLLLNKQKKFIAAAMTVVNETAARYHCSRVSLGWLEKGYIRLQSISHMEQFEPKMEIVNQLEAAMEEALDQDEEIQFPTPQAAGSINHDHEKYAEKQQVQQLISLPLRIAGQPVGVLTCERATDPFNSNDIRSLRILCDQISIPLAERKKTDRWFVAKLAESIKKKASGLLGAEHTLAKLVGLLCCGLLLAIITIKLPYRVEAPFILRSKDVRQITAPFAGYIDQVQVEIGQTVAPGSLLLSLDNSDLLLEEASALANRVRYLREAEKFQARNALIDMKIAQAQADQAQAQLELIQYRINQAQLRSPISGIIVVGDNTERLGAPVEKGELLFKVARHEKLFAEIKITEQDIHEITSEQTGELAFVSRPQQSYPFLIKQIDPLALTEESGNIFIGRSEVFAAGELWWRPGMSGIAKIEIGKRRIIWIISHRTVNFLRLLVWW
ncbi:MAG: HlyD family efflux transporter periplasmic adaptor subunit [Desulfuromusa sp.]|nr:HlyD family efflux transporter periplasmic adaptor subunit [Desulfuromusa sp.]